MTWNPTQYQKFTKEREEPFFDLLKLITPYPEMQIVDLGCGTGALTKVLYETLRAKNTLGVDSSREMLKESHPFVNETLTFQEISIEQFNPKEPIDLLFSNAALQWVPTHLEEIKRLTKYLTARGQIAIQMPANFDFPTHQIAKTLAKEAPFSIQEERPLTVLPLEEYAKLFFELGFEKQHVRCQVYPHRLESTTSAVEWVKGSLLTYYEARLSSSLYKQFLTEYQKRLLTYFGDQKPFFLPFKRILLYASGLKACR